jgi:hypothetical protein
MTGTKVAYQVLGDGPPVVCLPGGPMQDSVYLGDLSGLSARRQLIVLGRQASPDHAERYGRRHHDHRGLRLEIAQLRRDEPWFPAAFEALEAIIAGKATADSVQAIALFFRGRWDEAARAAAWPVLRPADAVVTRARWCHPRRRTGR